MEIRFYDLALKFLGIVENSTSIRWRRKYYEPGEFEIHMPITADNLALTSMQTLVWKEDSKEIGIIEKRIINESAGENEINISGRFASCIYDRRLIKATTFYNGKVEEIMRNIVSNVSPFPNVTLGELNGYTDTVTFQATYKNVLKYLTKLSKYGDIGYRLVPDFKARGLVFETYRGVNRTYSQNANSRVAFSDEFNTLNKATLTESNKLYKNVIYVGGLGKNEARTYVVCGDDESTGYDRWEDFLSATDISKTDDISDADYTNALKQRGNDKLKEDVISNAIEGSIVANANFKYKTDYELGDIVSVRKDRWGLSSEMRITEIEEVYEHGIPVITPTLGTPIPETVDWSDQ